MAKKIKQKQQHQPTDIRTFAIKKHKSFLHNLNTFIKMLEEEHGKLTSKEYLMEVHNFVTRYMEKTKKKDPAIGATRHKIKICKQCDGWKAGSNMLQCTLCEDYYHQSCLGEEKKEFEQTKLCKECDHEKISSFDKETYLSEFIEDRCHECGVERMNRESFVHCLRCSKRFHKKCYGKNAVAVCGNCKIEIDQQLKNKRQIRQSTLEEWACSSKKKSQTSSPISITTDVCFDHNEIKKQKNDDETRTQPYREKDLFCQNYDELTADEIQSYREDLTFAILAKNMKYIEELQPIQCSLDNNNEESLDFGLDHMTKTEFQTYKHYKRQPIGPFKLVFKEGMGYDVVADREIKEKTLICEYIGEVVSLRKCIELETVSKNDSLMELRSGCNSEQTLIIRPDRLTNMARFINGINNFKGTSKPNVATVRKLAKGMPTVVLYTLRNIRKGESLLYDYNAGTTTCKYDTSNFI